MNIKLIWSILCKESVINKENNNVSIHEALEELTIFITADKKKRTPQEGFKIPVSYEIVSLWAKEKFEDKFDGKVKYVLVDPEKKELLSAVQRIEIPSLVKRHRTRMKIGGLPVTVEGDYTFMLKVKAKGSKSYQIVTNLPLEVKIKVGNTTKKSA